MRHEKDIEIDGKSYVISEFPAVEGRDIMANYLTSSIPKLGEYKVNEETMFKLMSYVGVRMQEGTILWLKDRNLINNHVDRWERLIKIEGAMLEYNCSFFQGGRILTFFDDIVQKLPAWVLKISTIFLERSLPKEKPHSTN